jgi:hypothetical protein
MQVVRRTAELPAFVGAPGIAQGRYGDAGNLELLVPAACGGVEVLWFNADPVEHRRGATRGCWSGALHVFGEEPVTVARIAQAQAGPHFLEASVVTGGGALHRLYWTPADGFVSGGVLLDEVDTVSRTVELADGLHVLAARRDGTLVHLSAALPGYPDVRWRAHELASGVSAVALDGTAAAALVDGSAVVYGYDGAWRVVGIEPGPFSDVAVAGDRVLGLDATRRFAGVEARALTATRTTLDGGRIDVVLAVEGGLVHVHGDGTTWSAPRPVRSEVWAEPGAPIHRR